VSSLLKHFPLDTLINMLIINWFCRFTGSGTTRRGCGKRFVMMFARVLRKTSLIKTQLSPWGIPSSLIITTLLALPGHTPAPRLRNVLDVLQIFGTGQKVGGQLVWLCVKFPWLQCFAQSYRIYKYVTND